MKKVIVSCLFLSILLFTSVLNAQNSSVKVSMTGDAVAYGSSTEFQLKFENATDGNIDSLMYAFCIGDSEVDSLQVVFAAGLKPEKTSNKSFVFSMEDAVLGENELRMWCVSMNGNIIEPEKYDTTGLSFTYYDSTLVSPFHPVVEMFSSSNCSNCKPFNDAVAAGIEELVDLGLLNVVKYQVNAPTVDPYSTPDGNNRMAYYGVTGAPTSIYGGVDDVIGDWGPYPEFENMLNNLRYKVYEESGELRKVNVNLVDFTIDTVDHYLNLEFNLGAMENISLLVNAVVVEKNTYENVGANGEKEFHWITMAIPTNTGKGVVVDLKEGKCTENFHYQVDLGKTHAEEDSDLQVVFLLQRTSGTAIYQTFRFQPEFGDVEFDPSLSVVSPKETLEFELYPNPVSDQLYIHGVTSAQVSVFDLSGRCVIPSKILKEGSSLSVSGLASGVYVIRLVQDDKVGVRRFSVVR